MTTQQQILFRDPGPPENGFSQNGSDDVLYSVWCLREQIRKSQATDTAAEDICPPDVVRSLYDICDYFKLNSIVMCHSVALLQRLILNSANVQPATLPVTVAIAAKLHRRDVAVSQRRMKKLLETLGYTAATSNELFSTEQSILRSLNFNIDCNAVPEWIGALLGALVSRPSAAYPELAGFNWKHLLRPSLDLAVVYFVRRREMPDRLRNSAQVVAAAIITVVHMLIAQKVSPHHQLVKALCWLVNEQDDIAVMQDAFYLLNLFNVQQKN